MKKLAKEIQTQRYNFYEEERQNNIKRCIQNRRELIALTKKKSKIKLKKNKSFEKDQLENDKDLSNESNNNLRKSENNLKTKRINYKIFSEKNKKIFVTDNEYMLNNRDGSKTLITREDLDKITCLQDEKEKLGKKTEEKEEHLVRFLKNELNREKKLQNLKKKINEKEKKINKFLQNKNEGIKLIENGRYQDNQDVYERQKLYEKISSNYEKKIYMTKKQQQEQNKSSNINNEKLEEFKEKIDEYERKNSQFKKKISSMFDLKEKQEIEEKKIREKKFDPKNPDLGVRKLIDMEEKFELERYRRENALMTNINKFQNKINNILEKKEEKEKKIKKTIEEVEKKREEKILLKNIHYEEVRNKVKNNQINLEKQRNLKLQNLEKKDLKDFAIKQEKIKLHEERRKLNQRSYEERQEMRAKLKEILKEKKDNKNEENDEEIINQILIL